MKIALLTGGTSSEREIALQSAEEVRRALETDFEVMVFDLPKDLDRFIALRTEYACAVPVFHGRGGEDGQIQGFLESLHVPYLFSLVKAHAVGADKAMTKRIMAAHGVRTPNWLILGDKDVYEFQGPVVLKPQDGGSSLGVSLIHESETLAASLESAFKHASHVLVETLVTGREFTVGIVEEGGEARPLPVVEIRSKNTFFDYESKYDASLVEEICPAPIDTLLRDQLQEMALTAHTLIGARHLSRSDMIVDEQGEIWFLEIYTIPGLTENSLLPKALRAEGLDLRELLREWIEQSL